MENSTKMLVVAMVVASLVGCGKKENQESASAKPTAPVPATPVVDSAPAGATAGNTGLVPAQAGMVALDQAVLLSANPAKSACALDKINDQPAFSAQAIGVNNGSDVTFSGWIVNTSRQVPPAFVIVLSGESKTYGLRGQTGVSRPDVARVLGVDALVSAGYKVTAKLENVEPGEYTVSLIQDSNNIVTRCSTPTKIAVGR